jgi:hypothetical protein
MVEKYIEEQEARSTVATMRRARDIGFRARGSGWTDPKLNIQCPITKY